MQRGGFETREAPNEPLLDRSRRRLRAPTALVHGAKGNRNRVTLLPASLTDRSRTQAEFEAEAVRAVSAIA